MCPQNTFHYEALGRKEMPVILSASKCLHEMQSAGINGRIHHYLSGDNTRKTQWSRAAW